MEKRNLEFYNTKAWFGGCDWFTFVTNDPEENDLLTALTLALVEEKNVVLRPQHHVHLYGTIRTAASTASGFETGDKIVTSPIKAIYFDKIYEERNRDGYLSCVVETRNSTYCLSYEVILSSVLRQLRRRAERNGRKLEDYARFFSEINTDYKEYELVEDEKKVS